MVILANINIFTIKLKSGFEMKKIISTLLVLSLIIGFVAPLFAQKSNKTYTITSGDYSFSTIVDKPNYKKIEKTNLESGEVEYLECFFKKDSSSLQSISTKDFQVMAPIDLQSNWGLPYTRTEQRSTLIGAVVGAVTGVICGIFGLQWVTSTVSSVVAGIMAAKLSDITYKHVI